MPTKPLNYAALLDRYYQLQRAREIQAFCIPCNRKNHVRWQQAERRTRAVERHMLRVERLLSETAV